MKKSETDKKYEETNLKFEKTEQQIEIFKVCEKSKNGPKNMRKLNKKNGNHSTKNIGKRIQNIRKSLNNSELLNFRISKKNENSSKIIFDLFPCLVVSMSLLNIPVLPVNS